MNNRIGLLAITGILTLAACGQQTSTTPTPSPSPAQPSSGTVNFAGGMPADVTYEIRNSAGQVFTNASSLPPGNYTITFTAPGMDPVTKNFTVAAGQTVVVEVPVLMPRTGVFYKDAGGKLVKIPVETPAAVDASRFVFHAWMEDLTGGVNPATPGASAPTTAEMEEAAPSLTQNLAVGWVGYRAPDGNIYPVVGASVRWNIASRTGGTMFSAADDGNNHPGSPGGVPIDTAGPQSVSDAGQQADTLTNRGDIDSNAPFPMIAQYPLHNRTGINTPNRDGLTWTALFAPEKSAQATVVAVASIGQIEIGKAVLKKVFASAPKLELEKKIVSHTPGSDSLVHVKRGENVQLQVTVRNTGEGGAENVVLRDVLKDFANVGGTYEITQIDGATLNAQDGFDATFDLGAGQTKTITFTARASAPGTYCDVVDVIEYSNTHFDVLPGVPSQEACFVVLAPTINVVKTFVKVENETISPTSDLTVGAGHAATLRVTISNQGDGPLSIERIEDVLASGDGANYEIDGPVRNAQGEALASIEAGADGFVITPTQPLVIPSGASYDLFFDVRATADGEYCDAVSVISDSLGGDSTDEACLIVKTPKLEVVKDIVEEGPLGPGDTYTANISVKNTGSATATGLKVRDILGEHEDASITEYVKLDSAFLRNIAGTPSEDGTAVTSPEFSLEPGETVVFTVTSQVQQTPPGLYCDYASIVAYGNVDEDNVVYRDKLGKVVNAAFDCIAVELVAAQQNELVDTVDPIRVGDETGTQYSGVYYVERYSNEATTGNVFTFYLGTQNARGIEPGRFVLGGDVTLYYLDNPNVDPQTGLVTVGDSPTPAPAADYTVDTTVDGVVTVTYLKAIEPSDAVFIKLTNVYAPEDQNYPKQQYHTNSTWISVGALSGLEFNNFASEPTNVR